MATGIKIIVLMFINESDLTTTESISENQKGMIVNLILLNVWDRKLLLET